MVNIVNINGYTFNESEFYPKPIPQRKKVCSQCEYYGTKFQYIAKKKTCINPNSPYNGCKRGSNKTCKAFTIRSDGKIYGFPIAWYKAHKSYKRY